MSRRAVVLVALMVVGLGLGGYATGAVVEANTHALHVSRITGTPYLQVLGAWSRLQASDLTDTDVAAFEEDVNLAEQERF